MFWGDLILRQYIWVLWDLIAVLIFLRCVYRCAYRGFISTMIGLLVYIAAVVCATMFNKQIAQFLYNNVIYDVVQYSLTRSFDAILPQLGANPENIIQAIPFGLRMLIGHKRGAVESLPVDTAESLSRNIIDLALKDPLLTILHAAGFLLIFTIVTLFMRWLARLFTGVNKVPVIGALNSILGGIAGVIEGVLSLYISSFLLKILVAFSGEVWWWLNSAVMESTYIWRHFY